MIRALRLFPDPFLDRPCRPVGPASADSAALIRDLLDTLEGGPGVGLAAPQIGVGLRAAVIHVARARRPRGGTDHGRLVLLDPALLSADGEQTPREGCLSVPDLLADVRRYARVRVRFTDESGAVRTVAAEGFEALAFQHELDHLDGRLFLDRVADLRSGLFRRRLR